MTKLAIVILAAGLGTRMRSALPKVLHVAAGRTLIGHVLAAATAARSRPGGRGQGAHRSRHRARDRALPAARRHRRAARAAGHRPCGDDGGPALKGFSGTVLVLYGDCPSSAPKRSRLLATLDARTPLAVLGFGAADPYRLRAPDPEPEQGLTAIREELDASPKQRAIDLCNSGFIAVDAELLGGSCRGSATTTPRAKSI